MTHFKQGLNIISYCQNVIFTGVEITAGYQQKLTEDLLWPVRENFFHNKKIGRNALTPQIPPNTQPFPGKSFFHQAEQLPTSPTLAHASRHTATDLLCVS